VHIPTNPGFSSLNLAMAVQVICYELRMAAPSRPPVEGPKSDSRLATAAELEHLHEHLERLLSSSCAASFTRRRSSTTSSTFCAAL
jgi:tRNA C32,U32 (ribose-2'-O)-methylase TrmJ